MRINLWIGASLAGLLLLGCSRPDAVAPVLLSPAAGAEPGVVLGGVATRGDLCEQVTGLYTLTLEPETLTASLTPKETRSGQANDDVIDLDVRCFLHAGSVTLLRVSRSAGTIDITYRFEHPYSYAPPSTLGAPMRVLLLADATAPTFFPDDGDVVVNAGLVANADGFLDPGQLLDLTGFTATAFPYQALVDETLDNRDISNGGNVMGNWTTPSGWQTGFPATWTGFGWVHRGQTVTRTLSLNVAAVTAPVTLDLAFIAKYTKPNRSRATLSPTVPANVLDFGYRAYHGALDLERVRFVGESGGFRTNVESSSEFTLEVVDWDAHATETTRADLQNEPDGALVAIGESGEPRLQLSIPSLLGPTSYQLTEPADSGSGVAGDPLIFTETIEKDAGVGAAAGDHLAMVRVTDAEADSDTSKWHFAFDCADSGLVTGPGLDVYQVFTVNSTAGGWVYTGATQTEGYETAYGLACDPTSGDVYVTGRFVSGADFGGGPRAVTPHAQYLVKLNGAGVYQWDRVWQAAGSSTPGDCEVDALGNLLVGGGWTGTLGIAALGGGATDQTSNGRDIYILKFDPAGTYLGLYRSIGMGYESMEGQSRMAVSPTGHLYIPCRAVSGPVDFGLGEVVHVGGVDPYLMKLDIATMTPMWAPAMGAMSTENEEAFPVTLLLGSGDPVVGGYYIGGSPDFGGGRVPGTQGLWLSRRSAATGSHLWSRALGPALLYGLAASATQLVAAGSYYAAMSFGGPVRPNENTSPVMFLASYDHNNVYRWDYVPVSGGVQYTDDVTVGAAEVYAYFEVQGPTDLGGGARTPSGGVDLGLLRLSLDGAYVADRVWGAPTNEFPYDLVLSPQGDILLSGNWFGDAVDFDPNPANTVLRTNAGGNNSDFFVLKLRADTLYF